MKTTVLAGIITIVTSPAFAQFPEGKSTAKASNGVSVTIQGDTFANRYSFVSPEISTKSEKRATTFAYVTKLNNGDVKGDFAVIGFIIYTSQKWRYYNSALFRGGEAVDYVKLSSDVSNCSSACIYTERFSVRMTQEQTEKYTVNGKVDFQIGTEAEDDKVIISVPTKFIDAVNEIGK